MRMFLILFFLHFVCHSHSISRSEKNELIRPKKWNSPIEEEIGEKDGRKLNVKQVKIIFGYFGQLEQK